MSRTSTMWKRSLVTESEEVAAGVMDIGLAVYF